jgi:exopolysaccharide biosynthesis polyprenyl glycosylphosphotransferase
MTQPEAGRRGGRLGSWRWSRVVGDFLAGGVGLVLAFLVRLAVPMPFTRSLLPPDKLEFVPGALLVVLLTQNALLYFFGFYELPHPQERVERLQRLATVALLQGLLLVSFYFFADREFPRSVVLLHVPFVFALMLGQRALLDRVAPTPRRRVLVVGSGRDATQLLRSAERYPWYGFDVVGHVRTPGDPVDAEGPGPLLGEVADVPRLLATGVAEELILVSPAHSWQSELLEHIAQDRTSRASVLLLPGPFDSLLGGVRYRAIHDVPLIEVLTESQWREPRLLKRALDLTGGAVLFVVTLPLLAVGALAVRLGSPGPVLYRQERVGRDRRPFTLCKLRTMRADAERDGEELLASPDDPRLTGVGRVLRALRLDELPQLWNVLDGTMSLVGPRPERPGFVTQYLREVPGYTARFALRPGLTGLAQIHGDYYTSAENKLRYDLAYLANWSLWLDLAILVRTVRIVVTSKGN